MDRSVRVLIKEVIELAIHAGKLISAEASRLDGPRGYDDKATVDTEVETLLRKELLSLFAADFWGEETGYFLSGNPYCWVVDPNDGTQDFLAGRPGSAISIGLLNKGMPVLGVVYAPNSERGPDCIAWQEGMQGLLRNGQHIPPQLAKLGLTSNQLVFVSTAATKRAEINAELCAPAIFSPMPSIAYRLARVAVGDGVAGVSLYPVGPHDVIAGHALLLASGGDLFDQQGKPIRYTSLNNFYCSSCFGGNVTASQTLASRPWKTRLAICAT